MKPITPDTAHCAVRLRAAVSALGRQLRSALPAEGISVAKLSVLAHLYHDGPMSPTEVAQRERVRLQTLTRLLAELEADGWIARQAHPSDGRQSLLNLTRPGIKRLTADVHRREASLVDAIDAELSTEERALLVQACALIDRVSDALQAQPTEAASRGEVGGKAR